MENRSFYISCGDDTYVIQDSCNLYCRKQVIYVCDFLFSSVATSYSFRIFPLPHASTGLNGLSFIFWCNHFAILVCYDFLKGWCFANSVFSHVIIKCNTESRMEIIWSSLIKKLASLTHFLHILETWDRRVIYPPPSIFSDFNT